MAQTEDTELRDLVIEALEKNGSLAKIRALLRANIFLAFEDETQNIKHNLNLDNVLKLPEGLLCLSIVHEFLEFCNLKNTLFVYKSESRQEKEYKYEGREAIAGKLSLNARENPKEPLLMTLLKNAMKTYPREYRGQKDTAKNGDANYKDDQNCTYIVHEDSSSSASQSQSDNSSDEKNKLHLRLQLDNSDTDTSSDSTRDKSSSEYIPNEQVNIKVNENNDKKQNETKHNEMTTQIQNTTHFLQDLRITNNSSSDSTSYIELQPYNALDKKLLNTTGVPFTEVDEIDATSPIILQNMPNIPASLHDNRYKNDSASASVSSESSKSIKDENQATKSSEKKTLDSAKSEGGTAEYSYDFSSGSVSKNKDANTNLSNTPKSNKDVNIQNKSSVVESPHQNSQSSQSSVSISDVTDLVSEKSSSFGQTNEEFNQSQKKSPSLNQSKNVSHHTKNSNDSGDFSESPVPSLSNLSLDIHSD